jgi:hypothetical protein
VLTQNPISPWQDLAQENGSLRTIIAELLMTNQELRLRLASVWRSSLSSNQLGSP